LLIVIGDQWFRREKAALPSKEMNTAAFERTSLS